MIIYGYENLDKKDNSSQSNKDFTNENIEKRYGDRHHYSTNQENDSIDVNDQINLSGIDIEEFSTYHNTLSERLGEFRQAFNPYALPLLDNAESIIMNTPQNNKSKIESKVEEKQKYNLKLKEVESTNHVKHKEILFNSGNKLDLIKFNGFSCGVGILGGIEDIYLHYELGRIEYVINTLKKELNNYIKEYEYPFYTPILFIQFSLTQQYKELVQYFYKISNTVTDFDKNPNSDNNIAIFTIKLD